MAAHINHSSGCVLVADCDPVNLRRVTRIVEKQGFEALPASDGRETLRILRTSANFVAGIFEVVMPHVSGPDLVRHMKRDDRLIRIPVIMMTRSKNPMAGAESFAAGAVVLLQEPFTTVQLQAMLRMVTDINVTTRIGTTLNAPEPICQPYTPSR